MNITCPNCAASYHVSASAIGAEGRTVRCVRCRTAWFQEPKPEVPPLDVSPEKAGMQHPASDATVAAFQAELGAETQPPAHAPRAPADEKRDDNKDKIVGTWEVVKADGGGAPISSTATTLDGIPPETSSAIVSSLRRARRAAQSRRCHDRRSRTRGPRAACQRPPGEPSVVVR